jgi:hypothetical protein
MSWGRREDPPWEGAGPVRPGGPGGDGAGGGPGLLPSAGGWARHLALSAAVAVLAAAAELLRRALRRGEAGEAGEAGGPDDRYDDRYWN